MMQKVSKEKFDEFISAYPNPLVCSVDAIVEPPTTNYYDFSIGDGYRAIVASHWTDRMMNDTEYYIKPQS